MTNGCRVLLLRLADGMDARGYVSIPRSTLAEEFGVAPARITEQIKLARKLGFLDIVRRARPNVTAVYQATIPGPRGTPERTPDEVRQPGPIEVRQDVPQNGAPRYALPPTQVVTQSVTVEERSDLRSASADADGESHQRSVATATAVPPKAEHASPSIHPKSKGRPWAELDRQLGEGQIDDQDVTDAIEYAIGGFLSGDEERTAVGMISNGAKAIVIRNKILADRERDYQTAAARECPSCRRPTRSGGQQCTDCAVSAA